MKKKARKMTIRKKIVISEKDFEKKLKMFLDVWKDHVKDEIQIHAKLLKGKQPLSTHIKETIRLHRGFLQKMEKLV